MPIERGVLPLRRKTGRGIKPHFAARFGANGNRVTLGIDTSRCDECDFFLVTHAHSDHSGKSAMLSKRSIASVETARSLEILNGREFAGDTFEVGDTLDLGVEVETHDTGHTVGSSAFSWETETGVRVLVTGDVKDYSRLPECDVLFTESTYGDPEEPSHVFSDEIGKLGTALEERRGEPLFLGAYTFGKSQRAAMLVRELGYRGPIGMEGKARRVTEELMDVGHLVEAGDAPVNIVNPRSLARYGGKGYVLSGMAWYGRRIAISDHLDRRGLLRMVQHCDPELVVPFHPDDPGPCGRFADLVERELGIEAAPLHDRSEIMIL